MVSKKQNSKSRDDFEYWLFEMDDAILHFKNGLSGTIRSQLDFSRESLDVIEAWILENFERPNKILKPQSKDILDGLARYIGETFRKAIGGHWEIRYDDPRYVYYGLPQLTGFCEKSTPICPHSLVTAAIDRRIGTYLSTILENSKRRLRKSDT